MKWKSKAYSLIITLAFSMAGLLSVAQATGSFKGKIIEQSTKQSIIGASVHIDNTQLGATTDTTGVFTIHNIPIGTFSMTISSVGFQTKYISEITITANKTSYSEIELLEGASHLNEVVVRSYKGENNPLTPVSAYSYSREEIFRNPGAQGDIMRFCPVCRVW